MMLQIRCSTCSDMCGSCLPQVHCLLSCDEAPDVSQSRQGQRAQYTQAICCNARAVALHWRASNNAGSQSKRAKPVIQKASAGEESSQLQQ
jgi:hypothetical protein